MRTIDNDGLTEGDWKTEDLWDGVTFVKAEEMEAFYLKCGRYSWREIELSRETLLRLLNGEIFAIGDLEYSTFIALKGVIPDDE